jgi:uncharacterized LabA/DUF88 family protein
VGLITGRKASCRRFLVEKPVLPRYAGQAQSGTMRKQAATALETLVPVRFPKTVKEETFMTGDDAQRRLAVLIDADNAQPSITEGLLAEIANFGVATVKRIYGDWTTPHLQRWKEVLLQHSIQPVQQFRYTTGKNATDSAMIIDAMDLLYTRRFNGFCIVSSDSDFTRLASRIREEGLTVYGFGEKKTPHSFVSACDKFVYTEVLRSKEDGVTTADGGPPEKKSGNELKGDTKLVVLLRNAVESVADETGWAHLGGVGSKIANQAPDFDPRNYGYKRLGELVAATQLFDIEERLIGDGPSKDILIRDKRRKTNEASA